MTGAINGRGASRPTSGDLLSPSQVSNLMDCAYRWYGKYVLDLPDPPTGNLALGRAVHSALAENFSQKCETKVDLPNPGVLAVFREVWSVESERTEFRDDEDPTELRQTGEILVAKYMDQAAPRIEPTAVELHVQGVISGVNVRGFLDLLDVDGRVIEIKTAKARPSAIDPMHKFQVATYHRLTTGATGAGRIDTLVKTKSPQLIQQPFSITEQELRATETLYPLAQELMRGGVYVPNRQSMMCSRRNCAYWRHCEQTWGGEVPET
jgi:CRISPR/Cas system-associated exonuclease Cas4 (RecB family)